MNESKIGGNSAQLSRGPIGGATVVGPGEVTREVNRLAVNVDHLIKAFEVLENKVKPIYSPKPQPERANGKTPSVSSIGGQISEQISRIESIANAVLVLSEGIEL